MITVVGMFQKKIHTRLSGRFLKRQQVLGVSSYLAQFLPGMSVS
jgi:hypothetical protein